MGVKIKILNLCYMYYIQYIVTDIVVFLYSNIIVLIVSCYSSKPCQLLIMFLIAVSKMIHLVTNTCTETTFCFQSLSMVNYLQLVPQWSSTPFN